MVEYCELCGKESTIELLSDGTCQNRRPLYRSSYTNRLLCSRCYVRDNERYELIAWSKARYGPNKEPAFLK